MRSRTVPASMSWRTKTADVDLSLPYVNVKLIPNWTRTQKTHASLCSRVFRLRNLSLRFLRGRGSGGGGWAEAGVNRARSPRLVQDRYDIICEINAVAGIH